MPSGTTATESSSGNRSRMPAIVSASTAPSLTPGHTTIWPRTAMSWSSSARSQRRLIAPRGFFSMWLRTSGSVAWMLTCSGDSRSVTTRSRSASVNRVKRGEVPVQERQAVVVVLQVQAAAHALGQLVDEAELAVVVARADPVEHALDTSMPSDSPARFSIENARSSPPRSTSSSTSASSVASCHSMMSRGTSPLTRTISSPAWTPTARGRRPGRDRDDDRGERARRRRALDVELAGTADVGR